MTASDVPRSRPSSSRIESAADLGVVVLAEGDGRAADVLDEVEDRGPGLLRDDLAQQRPHQPDLGRKRVARPGRADPAGLGADRDGRR